MSPGQQGQLIAYINALDNQPLGVTNGKNITGDYIRFDEISQKNVYDESQTKNDFTLNVYIKGIDRALMFDRILQINENLEGYNFNAFGLFVQKLKLVKPEVYVNENGTNFTGLLHYVIRVENKYLPKYITSRDFNEVSP